MRALAILHVVMALALALSTLPSAAADITVLDRPGAVHLPPPSTAPPKPSSFSFAPSAAAASAPMGSRANTTLVPAVRLTGYIMPGDAAKMREALDTIASYPAARADGPLTTIELSSMGGSLMDGFEIGTLMRRYHLLAVVRAGDLCLSSCALALVGGNIQRVPQSYPTRCNIEVGGKVGFHNFFLNPASVRESSGNDPVASRLQGFNDARGGAAALVGYAERMGIPPSFVAGLIGRPADDFEYVETVGQFISLGHADANSPLQARLLPRETVRRYLLERVQALMMMSRARGRLSGLLANGGVMRVNEEIERLYEDLWSAGVALPEIVGPTYEISIDRPGGRQLACYVSLSPDDPDRFDVVTVGARGFSDPPRLPPENARRLFLFDKRTVVNPRPT